MTVFFPGIITCTIPNNGNNGTMVMYITQHNVYMSMQYTANFNSCKNRNKYLKNLVVFLIFSQNIEAVLTSTHNLCF